MSILREMKEEFLILFLRLKPEILTLLRCLDLDGNYRNHLASYYFTYEGGPW